MYVSDPGLEYVISTKLFIDSPTHKKPVWGLTSKVSTELRKELVFDLKLEVLFKCLTFQY